MTTEGEAQLHFWNKAGKFVSTEALGFAPGERTPRKLLDRVGQLLSMHAKELGADVGRVEVNFTVNIT